MRLRGALAVWLVFVSSGVLADKGGCQQYTGPFTSNLVPPPGCTSPIGVCTIGQLMGKVSGLYEFEMLTLTCGPDLDDPCTYTGVSTVTTDKGIVETLDTGVLTFVPFAPTPFTTTAEFVDDTGTRRYRNADGAFVASGEIDFGTGAASGEYSLEICHGGA